MIKRILLVTLFPLILFILAILIGISFIVYGDTKVLGYPFLDFWLGEYV